MARKGNTSRIDSRLDVEAKEIIKAMGLTPRYILEGFAYGYLFDSTMSEKAGSVFNLKEEMKKAESDLEKANHNKEFIEGQIDFFEKEIRRFERELKKVEKDVLEKEKQIDSLNSIKDLLKKEPVDLDKVKDDRIQNAANEVSAYLQEKEDQREKGQFIPRVSEKRLNVICSKYHVRLAEVTPHINKILIKGINNHEKYL